jgi:hypothetical protein
MITRRQFESLVENILLRLKETSTVGTTPTVKATDKYRYGADGKARELPDDKVDANAKTQMPPTMAPPTVPAPKSSTQQQADKELSTMNTRNPKAAPPSQKTIKVNAIKKELDKSGFTSTPEGAKFVTANLNNWYDQLDPSDALVSTADQLAQRFTNND